MSNSKRQLSIELVPVQFLNLPILRKMWNWAEYMNANVREGLHRPRKLIVRPMLARTESTAMYRVHLVLL